MADAIETFSEERKRITETYKVIENAIAKDLPVPPGFMNHLNHASTCLLQCNPPCDTLKLKQLIETHLKNFRRNVRSLSTNVVLSALLLHAIQCEQEHCNTRYCQDIRDIYSENSEWTRSECCGIVRFSDSCWFDLKEQVNICTDYHIFFQGSLGEGTNGDVYYQWLGKFGEAAVAVKLARYNCQKETEIATIFGSHPHLLTSQLILEDSSNNNFSMLFMEKGDCTLFDYIMAYNNLHGSYLTIEIAFIFIRQLLVALKTLHKNKIIHGDIKAKNIVLVNNMQQVKLIDFDGFKFVNSTDPISCTYGYAAPEVVAEPIAVNCVADIFSLGMTIAEMFLGDMAIRRCSNYLEEIGRRREKIIIGLYKIDPQIACFVQMCLDMNPSSRPSARKLLSEFKENGRFYEVYRRCGNVPIVPLPVPNDASEIKRFLTHRITSYMDENLPKRLPERHQAVLARDILNTEEEMLVD